MWHNSCFCICSLNTGSCQFCGYSGAVCLFVYMEINANSYICQTVPTHRNDLQTTKLALNIPLKFEKKDFFNTIHFKEFTWICSGSFFFFFCFYLKTLGQVLYKNTSCIYSGLMHLEPNKESPRMSIIQQRHTGEKREDKERLEMQWLSE